MLRGLRRSFGGGAGGCARRGGRGRCSLSLGSTVFVVRDCGGGGKLSGRKGVRRAGEGHCQRRRGPRLPQAASGAAVRGPGRWRGIGLGGRRGPEGYTWWLGVEGVEVRRSALLRRRAKSSSLSRAISLQRLLALLGLFVFDQLRRTRIISQLGRWKSMSMY